MDFSAITSIGGLKAATDIVKAINSIVRSVEINGKVTELQQIILSLQSNLLQVQIDLSKSQQEKFDLTKIIVELEKSSSFESGYELHEVESGKYIYYRVGQSDEYEHWLCSNCFSKKQKSIIQLYGNNDSDRNFIYPVCNFRLSVSNY